MDSAECRSENGIGDSLERSHSEAGPRLWPDPELPLAPLLERSCSDCGQQGPGAGGSRKKQGKFRRVLSETWWVGRTSNLDLHHSEMAQDIHFSFILYCPSPQRKVDLEYAAFRQFSYFAGTILPGFLSSPLIIRHQMKQIWIQTETAATRRLWWWSVTQSVILTRVKMTRTPRTRAGIPCPELTLGSCRRWGARARDATSTSSSPTLTLTSSTSALKRMRRKMTRMRGNKNLVQKELLTGEQVFLKRCVFLFSLASIPAGTRSW